MRHAAFCPNKKGRSQPASTLVSDGEPVRFPWIVSNKPKIWFSVSFNKSSPGFRPWAKLRPAFGRKEWTQERQFPDVPNRFPPMEFTRFSPLGEIAARLLAAKGGLRNVSFLTFRSLSKKGSDVSRLTRPRLYAVGRADSSSSLPQLFCKNKAEIRIFRTNNFHCRGFAPCNPTSL